MGMPVLAIRVTKSVCVCMSSMCKVYACGVPATLLRNSSRCSRACHEHEGDVSDGIHPRVCIICLTEAVRAE